MVNETEMMPEGSTMTPSQVRKLKIAIAIMSVMLVAGFILLLVGIYLQTQKLDKKAKAQAGAPAPISVEGPAIVNLPVKPGAELSRIVTDDGRLILHLRQSGESEIVIVDLATGQELRRIRLVPADAP